MGFGLHTIAHLGGDIVSPIANGIGAVTGNNQLTNLGHAIGSPNQVYTGGLSPHGVFNSISNQSTDFSPVAQPYNTNTANAGQQNSNGIVRGVSTPDPYSPYRPAPTIPTGPTAEQLAANKQAADLANFNLGLLPQQLQSAYGNIQHSYDQNNNELQSGYNSAQQGYHQSTDQNGQQFVTNKNQIANQAGNSLHSILSLLASHGAGGSSAAQYAAPNAVNQVSAQQRAGAGQTFGQNQQALDTNWGNYQNGFNNSKKQLSDWLGQQRQTAQTNNENSRQDILQQLAGLQRNTTAAQPFIDQIKASAAHVADLANFNPSYNGTTPTYKAPDVASYTVDQAGAPVLGQQGNNTAAGAPYLQFLQGLKDKQQQQPAF